MVKLSKDAVDELTLVEMEAYECLMTAVYLIELFNFEEALNMLLKAKVIFEQLKGYQEVVDSMIYEEKVNQVETFIR